MAEVVEVVEVMGLAGSEACRLWKGRTPSGGGCRVEARAGTKPLIEGATR